MAIMNVEQEFVTAVRKYINLIEHAKELNIDNFLSECRVILPQIYYLGQQLPNVEVTDNILNLDRKKEDSNRTFKESSLAFGNLRNYLGDKDTYKHIWDPIYDQKVMEGFISDDLAGIYGDLKNQLEEYESNEELRKQAAIWEWKFTLQGHAGKHLVDVLSAIHHLLS